MKFFEIKQIESTNLAAMAEVARVLESSSTADGLTGDYDYHLSEIEATWNGDYIFIAYLGGNAIGVVSDSSLGEALDVWVVLEHRNQFVEDALMSAIEAFCCLNGKSKLEAAAGQSREWVNELLHSRGYIFRGGDFVAKMLQEPVPVVA
jgi:hypothetical protein